jgi:hypothetical protein
MLTLCSTVTDDIKAHESVISGSTVEQGTGFLQHTALEPRCFYILSAAGTVHPVHFDGSTFHTLLNVLSRFKLVLLACPISNTEPTPPNLFGGDPFIIMKSDRIIIYLIVLKPGVHLYVSYSSIFLNKATHPTKTFKHYAARVISLGRDS